LLLLTMAAAGNSFAQDGAKSYEPNLASLERYDPAPEWFKDA
jgi:hypothetical protein